MVEYLAWGEDVSGTWYKGPDPGGQNGNLVSNVFSAFGEGAR